MGGHDWAPIHIHVDETARRLFPIGRQTPSGCQWVLRAGSGRGAESSRATVSGHDSASSDVGVSEDRVESQRRTKAKCSSGMLRQIIMAHASTKTARDSGADSRERFGLMNSAISTPQLPHWGVQP